MHPLKDIRWTTRAEVCEKLLQFMHQTAPISEADGSPEAQIDSRRRAMQLLAVLADQTCAPALRQILLARNQEKEVRIEACEALVRLKAEPPVEELRELLEDRPFWESPNHYHHLIGLLCLFRSEEAQQLARSFLEDWSAVDRVRLFSDPCMNLDNPPEALVDWLYDCWLNEDRWLTAEVMEGDGEDAEPINCEIAWTRHKGPKSLAIFLDYWRCADGERREELRDRLRDFGEGVPAAWVADNLAEFNELAEAFYLTHADLLEYFGAEPLLQRIEAKLREISRQRRAEPDDYSPVHTNEFLRIIGLMAEWPEFAMIDRIRSLFCCPDTDTEVRWEFCYSLWKEHRDEVVSLALAAGQQAGDLELPARVLRWVVDGPQAGDRDLLWWSAWQEGHPQLPYWALQGLEQLSEDSEPWRERLAELARSVDPFARLQAAAALVRRGEEARRAEIVREAEEAKDPCVRAEAIRVLGELGGDQHLDLFQKALWTDGPEYIVRDDPDDESRYSTFIPTAEEGALALARVGTPEALTTLTQAYLVLPYGDPRFAAGEYLGTIVARMEGRNEPFDIMPWTGWRQERFGRLP